ncbi:MAG: FkbM family methyltransferase, partial [Candidatus Nitrosothermus koennekii]
PYNYEYLKKNIELNDIKNVIISNKAVSNYKGITFISSKGSQSKLTNKGIKVNVTTIDDLLNEYRIDRIDALKMDIEGSEYEALDGEFLNTCKRLMVEIHDDSYEEIHDRLKRYNFKIIEWRPSKTAIVKQSVKHFGHFCDAELKSGFPATKMIFRYIFGKDIPYMNDSKLKMVYAYKL